MEHIFVTPEEKLKEAVRIFRTQANLHDNAPLSALVKHAQGSGKNRLGADMVRDAAHDYEHWVRRMRREGGDPHVLYAVDGCDGPPADEPPIPKGVPMHTSEPFSPERVPQDPRPTETAARRKTTRPKRSPEQTRTTEPLPEPELEEEILY